MADRRSHDTVKVKPPWRPKGAIDIDVLLAPLICELWRLWIVTCQCCQECWPGLASIEFPGTGEAEAFLLVAQKDYKAELETWDEGEHGEYSIRLRLLVNFPTADIPHLVQAFSIVKRKTNGDIVPRARVPGAAPRPKRQVAGGAKGKRGKE